MLLFLSDTTLIYQQTVNTQYNSMWSRDCDLFILCTNYCICICVYVYIYIYIYIYWYP